MPELPLTSRRSFIASTITAAAFLEPLTDGDAADPPLRVDEWDEEWDLNGETVQVRRVHIESKENLNLPVIFEQPDAVAFAKPRLWNMPYFDADGLEEMGYASLTACFAAVLDQARAIYQPEEQGKIHPVYVTYNVTNRSLHHAFGALPFRAGVTDLRLMLPVKLTVAAPR